MTLPFLPYVLLGDAIFILTAFVFITVNNGWLLIQMVQHWLQGCSVSSYVTPALTAHIVMWWIVGTSGVICNLYVLVNWHPSPSYDPFQYILANILAYSSNYSIPWSNIFLAIDRILILTLPFSRSKRVRRCVSVLGVSVCATSFVSIVAIFVFSQLPRDLTPFVSCVTLACMMEPNVYEGLVAYNNACSLLHFVVAVACLLLIKRFNVVTQVASKRSRMGEAMVLYTIVVELCLDLLPLAVSLFLINVVKFNPNDYLGPYLRVLFALDGILSNRKYCSSIKKLFRETEQSRTVTVTKSHVSKVSDR